MNITFHTISAIGIAVSITDTNRLKKQFSLGNKVMLGFSACLAGTFSHGLLDYIPHCYPFRSKADIIIGFLIILISFVFTNNKYRLVVMLTMFGCILPDLIDELPRIGTKWTGIHFPVHENYFPWHWPEYSGSLYKKPNMVSFFNHTMILFLVALICWLRRNDFLEIFNLKTRPT